MEVLSQWDILAPILAGVGAVMGAGIGISMIAKGAFKGYSIATEPKVRKEITGIVLLTSAFVEGVALFAAIALIGLVFQIVQIAG